MSQTLTAPSPAPSQLRCICGHLFTEHPAPCSITPDWASERQRLRELEADNDFDDLSDVHRRALLRAREEFPGRRAFWRDEFRRLRQSRKVSQ
jgi:hypothetical protein